MNVWNSLYPMMLESGWKLGLIVVAAVVVPRVIGAIRRRWVMR